MLLYDELEMFYFSSEAGRRSEKNNNARIPEVN